MDQSPCRATPACIRSSPRQGDLRVLLVSLFHPELIRGGAQQICYELFEELKQQPGVVPTLLASIDPRYPGAVQERRLHHGVRRAADEFLFLMQDYDYWWHKTSSPRHDRGVCRVPATPCGRTSCISTISSPSASIC